MLNNSEGKNINISITSGTIIRAILFLVLVYLVYLLWDIVIIIITSIVVASAIEPATRWFEKRRIPRTIGVITVYLITFLIFGAIFLFIIPPLASDLANLASTLPQYIDNSFNIVDLPSFFAVLPGSLSGAVSDLATNIQGSIGEITSGFFRTASVVFGGALSFVLIIIISFYLAVQKNGIENFLRLVTPTKNEEYILNLWRRGQKKIGLWLQGQILLGVLIGVLVYLGLTILGVKYALTFAILAMVFELIPMFGPILASIPAIIVAFLQAPTLGLMVLALYVIIQQFENHLIYPLVVKKVVGIPPLVVILSLIIGGQLAGFFGLLLAVPVTAVLMEFANDVTESKNVFNKEKEKAV